MAHTLTDLEFARVLEDMIIEEIECIHNQHYRYKDALVDRMMVINKMIGYTLIHHVSNEHM